MIGAENPNIQRSVPPGKLEPQKTPPSKDDKAGLAVPDETRPKVDSVKESLAGRAQVKIDTMALKGSEATRTPERLTEALDKFKKEFNKEYKGLSKIANKISDKLSMEDFNQRRNIISRDDESMFNKVEKPFNKKVTQAISKAESTLKELK